MSVGRYQGGRSPWRPSLDLSTLQLPKEAAACCMSRVDAQGRPPLGFCGDDCERRVRAVLIREFVAEAQVPPARVVAYLDAHPGWEPQSSVWDDPTGDAVVGAVG